MGGRTEAATAARSKRAALRRRLKEEPDFGADLLAGPSESDYSATAEDMPLEDLLRNIPGLGGLERANIIARIGIPPDVRLAYLPTTTRREIAAAVREEIA